MGISEGVFIILASMKIATSLFASFFDAIDHGCVHDILTASVIPLPGLPL
jgi:hypothetical protein